MKNTLLIAFTLLFCLKVAAQKSNVILFTENGERFYAILNGIRMNTEPVTNLKVQDLNQPNYALKVIFENKAIGEMNKTLYVEAGVEAVYAVRLDNKGSYKLGFRSSVPIAQASPLAPQQQIVYWGAPAPVASTTVVQQTTTTTNNGGNGNVAPGGNVNTTTSTGTGENVNINMNVNSNGAGTNMNTGTGENMSMNVNTNGLGMNVNINATGTGSSTNVTNSNLTTTTTTTTTTTNPHPVVNSQPVEIGRASCRERV